jgi:choloylglycine hydrolase
MGGQVLLAAHNDYSFAATFKLVITPPHDGSFGRLCTAMETVPGWSPMSMKCMNDQGLVITHANVPKSQTPYDPDKPQFRHNFLDKIVAECVTVKQAVNLIRAYSLPPGEHGAHVHLMLADPSGEAVVVEWVDGEVRVIPRNGPTLLMTNWVLSKAETATGPSSRYARASRLLPEIREATVESLMPVVKELSVYARVKGQEVGSLDTEIWDPVRRRVHMYYHCDFDHALVMDLDKEFAKGARTVDLGQLFPNAKPSSSEWRDENGPVKGRVKPQ